MLCYMSFSVNLNSVDGTKIVAGRTNQIQYNFAFDKTPEHKGGYNVYMTFISQAFEERVFGFYFPAIYVNIDLGASSSSTPTPDFTGRRNNQVLGVIREKFLLNQLVRQINKGTTTATAVVPANSNTNAYTLTTTDITLATYDFSPQRLYIFAGYNENPPVYFETKPSNNQFLISLRNASGALQPEAEFLNTDYSVILTFEAV